MQDDIVNRKRARNIDHALVGTAAPVKLRIGLRLYKTTVDQHVNLIEKRQPLDFLPAIAGVQPDGLVRKLLPNLAAQLADLLTVAGEKRIAAGKRDAGDIVLAELGEQLILCCLIKQQTAFRIPCDGVVTAGTGVSAAGHPQHNTQAVAVEHIVLGYIVILHSCYTLFLSAISAILASFRRVSPLTRE